MSPLISESYSPFPLPLPLPPPLDGPLASSCTLLRGVGVFGVDFAFLVLGGVDAISGLVSLSEADEIGEEGIWDELRFIESICTISPLSDRHSLILG